MPEQRKVTEAAAPPMNATGATGTTGKTDETPPKPKATPRDRSKLGKAEERLAEMFTMVGMVQMGLGTASGDMRHFVGGQATTDLGPSVAAAWCKLGRENKRVEAVILKITEGGAWGEAILATAGLVYTQAQIYGALSAEMPNPWASPPVVPPSPDVAAHAAATAGPYATGGNGGVTPEQGAADTAGVPVHGRSAEDARSGLEADDPAHNEAERIRREVERRRKQRGS